MRALSPQELQLVWKPQTPRRLLFPVLCLPRPCVPVQFASRTAFPSVGGLLGEVEGAGEKVQERTDWPVLRGHTYLEVDTSRDYTVYSFHG